MGLHCKVVVGHQNALYFNGHELVTAAPADIERPTATFESLFEHARPPATFGLSAEGQLDSAMGSLPLGEVRN
jgi:hypothetical protein